MLKKIIIGVVLAVFLSTLFLTGCGKKNKLELKITKYAEENYTEEGLEIHLLDFTDFDWDKVVVFQYPVSKKEISEAIGVEYKKSLDLLSGMIFVYESRIIYEEIFENNDSFKNKVSPFVIYPHEDINEKSHFKVFTPEEAVFKCWVKQYDHKNWYFRLYPHEELSDSK